MQNELFAGSGQLTGFKVHASTTPSKTNPVVLMWAFLVGPFFVSFAVSPTGETQIRPGCLRIVAVVSGSC